MVRTSEAEDGDLEEAQFLLHPMFPSSGCAREAGEVMGTSPLSQGLFHPALSHAPIHLQVASRRGVVDLDIAVVGAWQQLTISEPGDCGTWVGKDLTGDVHLVPLPSVHSHRALELGGICNE